MIPNARLAFVAAAACTLLATTACKPSAENQQPVGKNSQIMAVDTPPPEYPLRQACDGIGGIVELNINVGSDGLVTGSSIVRSSGNPELDAAAQEGVKKWKFEPPYRNGKAVSTSIRSPLNFKAPEDGDPRCTDLNHPTAAS